MNWIELGKRLAAIKPNSGEAHAFAADLTEQARYPSRLAVQKFLSSDDPLAASKGVAVLEQMGALGVYAVASANPSGNAGREIWALRFLVEETIAARRRAVTALAKLLGDKQELPPDASNAGSRIPAGVRVCDLAFTVLLRVLKMKQSPETFFKQPPPERDKLIRKLESSGHVRDIVRK